MENFEKELLVFLKDTYLKEMKSLDMFLKENYTGKLLRPIVKVLTEIKENGLIELSTTNKISKSTKVGEIDLKAKILKNGIEEINKNKTEVDLNELSNTLKGMLDFIKEQKNQEKIQKVLDAVNNKEIDQVDAEKTLQVVANFAQIGQLLISIADKF